MTFSDIVTVLGAGAGILLLLAVAAAPLLADLDPNPRRGSERAANTPRAVDVPAPRAVDVPAPRAMDVPAPRSPAAVETMARVSGHARPAAAG